MLVRFLKYFGVGLLFLFILVNIILAYWGLTSIIFTAIVYTGIWWVARFVLGRTVAPAERLANYNVMVTSLLLSLFAAELVFKVIVKTDGVKGNDFGFTSQPFGTPTIENLIYKYVLHRKDLKLKNFEPNSFDINENSEFRYGHKYNSLGFRGKDFSQDSTLFNIITLGDSYTEGVGVTADSTWPYLLQAKLNKKNAPGQKVQCINGGIRGTDPLYEYVILSELLLKYKPGIVMVCVNETDIGDVVKRGGWERFNKAGCLQRARPLPWWYFLYQSSVIARFIIHSHYSNNWLLMTDEDYAREKKKAIEKIEKCIINDYQKLATENNFKLIVIFHPMQYELENDAFELQEVDDYLHKNTSIETINLFEGFKRENEMNGISYKSLYWPVDGHNNSAGYNLWADIITDKVRRN